MVKKAKPKGKDEEVPFNIELLNIELHPHVWCDSFHEQYIVEGAEQTEHVTGPEFKVIKALYLAWKNSPTGVALVQTDVLVLAVYKGSKKPYEDLKESLSKQVIYEINRKIRKLHGAKIIKHNSARDAYLLIPASECEVCSPATAPKKASPHVRQPGGHTKTGPLRP